MALLQMAIDRVSVSEAENIISLANGKVDIVEIGTSLIKDFGVVDSVGFLKKQFPKQVILVDLKIIDEGNTNSIRFLTPDRMSPQSWGRPHIQPSGPVKRQRGNAIANI
ncbi:MAG: orotidine 5'-phosphate decarboxylase [Treponema sp.]|jgi:3-keto-L-gulonate-6-phosphate decarboxylase|nr:orotidine 5'-phosphate decarboxylase [Treponema sp.]